MSIFQKVVVINDWEYLTYKVGDIQLDEKRGGTLDVRWPDGTMERVLFVSHPCRRQYSDHGHTHVANAFKLIAKVRHHGLWIEIPIEDLEVANVSQ